MGTNFTVDDPKVLAGVLASVPEREEVPQVEFAYNTKVSGAGPVRCIHCKKTYENHFRGFVLIFSDGARMLVGKDCGRKLYGQDFKLVERRFSDAREQGYYLRRRDAALAAAPELLKGLDQLGAHEAVRAFRDLKRAFNRGMPILSSVLTHSIARQGAMLMYEVEVRDYAAEDRRLDDAEARAAREGRKWVPPKNLKPIMKIEERRFGVLSGVEFFRADAAPDDTIFAVGGKLKSAFAALAKTSRTTDIRAFFKGLAGSLEQVRTQVARVSTLPAAMSDANLTLLAGWAVQRDIKGYAHNGTALVYSEPGEPDATLFLPAGFRAPTDATIVAFETALGGEVNAGFNRSI